MTKAAKHPTGISAVILNGVFLVLSLFDVDLDQEQIALLNVFVVGLVSAFTPRQ